ncbi:MAG: RNA pyrophosphohydrolase [Alphaproteobacteria bacterium]|nr:RNA pyrophosphohydrolase [Alphaproteobacteria bacterium]
MKKYRPNAGIVLFRKDGKVLLCERVENYPKRWQFPQGGIDKGETPLQAAVRELREETSVVSVTFVASLQEPLRYDFPPEVKNRHPERNNDGQEQYWHLFYFTGQDKEINLNTDEAEFRSYEWVDITQVPQKVVDFKQKIYQIVVDKFSKIIQHYLQT